MEMKIMSRTSWISWLRNWRTDSKRAPAKPPGRFSRRRSLLLERLDDRCVLSAMALNTPLPQPDAVLQAQASPTSFHGFLGRSAVQLNINADGASVALPNGTIHALPSGPVFGLLTAATPPSPVVPPSPVIPTSFQGFLGRSSLELNINVDSTTFTLPSDTVVVPPNPCLPGLLTAAGWDGQLDN